MSEFSSDILVPLVASCLRRLEYSPSEPPFYGRIALFDETRKPDFATPLHHRALGYALPDQRRLASKRTMEMEVARWSSEGGVECQALVKPGCGFFKNGGLPASSDVAEVFRDFSLDGTLVIFIFGFNDNRDEPSWEYQEQVEQSMRRHAESYYQNKDCKVAFIEMNDHHGNQSQWMTDIAWKLAEEKPDSVIFLPTTTWNPATQASSQEDGEQEEEEEELKFPFPKRGWSSESHDKDTWHISHCGLMEWLPAVRDFVKRLAKKHGRSKVLLITDSTFQAHDYIQCEFVLVQAGDGAITTFGISKSSTVRHLKDLIVKSGFPRLGIPLDQMDLCKLGEGGIVLDDEQLLTDCRVGDGVMLHLQIRGNSGDPSPGVPGLSTLSFYLASSFCGEATEIDMGLFRIPLNGSVESSENGKCYFGAGYRDGKTMSEEASVGGRWALTTGIYGSKDRDVALLYACPYLHSVRGGVKSCKTVLEGHVKAGTWQECGFLGFWHVPNKHDIEIVALIVDVRESVSNGAALGYQNLRESTSSDPTFGHQDANLHHAVEVTPELEHPSGQNTSGGRSSVYEPVEEEVGPQEEEVPAATSTSQLTLEGQPMPWLLNLYQSRFKQTPKWGDPEKNPHNDQQFRVAISSGPGHQGVQGDWTLGKQEAKRVALIKLLSEIPAAVSPLELSPVLSQLNEQFQKTFKSCPVWLDFLCSSEGRFKAAIRLNGSDVVEGPECDSKQEAKIAALRQAIQSRD